MPTIISIVSAAGAEDRKTASLLARRLAVYRPPGNLREKQKLSAARWDPAKPCDWLLVVCTPEAREDGTVLAAIDVFLKTGRRDRILLALAQGEPGESFPRPLRFERDENGNKTEREPLAADIRGTNPWAVRKKLRTEILRLLAPVYGVGYDDLRQRRRERALKLALAASAFAALLTAGFMIFALGRTDTIRQQNTDLDQKLAQTLQSEQEASRKRDESVAARSRTLSVQAQDQLAWGDTQMALLLALEALPEETDAEATEQGQKALLDALTAYCSEGYVSVTAWTPVSGQPAVFADAMNNLDRTSADASEQGLPDALYIDGYTYKKTFYHPDADAAVYYSSRSDDKTAPWCIIYKEGDSEPYRPLTAPNGGNAAVFEAGVSPEGILYAQYDGGVYRWDLATGACEGPVDLGIDDMDELSCLLFSDSGKWIFIGERFGRAWLMDAATQKVVTTITDEMYTARTYDSVDLDILDDGIAPMLAFSNGKQAAVCDLLTGEITCELHYDGDPVTRPEWSADGRLIAALCRSTVRIYDARTGDILLSFAADSDSGVHFAGAYDERVGHCGGEALILQRPDGDSNVCKFLLIYRDEPIGIPDNLEDRISLAKELLGGRTLTEREKDKFHVG